MAQRPRTPSLNEPAPGTPARWRSHPVVHGLMLAALAAYYLVVSWRRWPDPISDFGRELYVPWRLAEGAVLYRDVDDFYGPLSQYVNAGLFRVFGPGLMVLVTANLVVFAGIVALLYNLVRRAWGATAALAALGVFVAVFGFSRFLFAGNFTYAAPYAHETTHGMLVLVALAAVLVRWVERPALFNSAVAGGLFGLTCVLKPEFILSGAGLLVMAVILQRRQGTPWRRDLAAVATVGALLPTLAFTVYFSRHVAFADAAAYAGRAWLSVVGTTRFVGDPAQARYAGLDTPGAHLWEQTGAVIAALGLLAILAVMGRACERLRGTQARSAEWAGLAILAAVAVSVPAAFWRESGRCLPGLLVLYVGWRLWRRNRIDAAVTEAGAENVRWLLAVMGVTLLARMALNGRLYHFGYYQAAIAAVVVVAVVVGELPACVATTARSRRWLVAGALALILPGVVTLSRLSHETYRALTLPLGEGRDRFYTYGAAEPFARIAGQLKTLPPTTTLLVLPEGLMLNYLPRLRSPLAPFFFYSAATEGGREAQLVAELQQRPPDYVITVPRDLSEYGIRLYGERPGAGGELMRWVAANYHGAPGDPAPAYRGDAIQVFQRTARAADR
ncbi:hypothetical protein [Horticoccus sp. 23ND18S-11]|uniref:hypothetical protein n=1 Tax=Horticoccus sp. 23ND18S-11 TaxID=3391832 RepID=UPI0039C9BC04